MAEQTKKDNIFKKFGKFIHEVRIELKKVTWPTRQQLIKNTLVVIVFLIVIGLLVFGVDLLFQQGIFGTNGLFGLITKAK